jgi:hydrogenase expression/formation protein HypD
MTKLANAIAKCTTRSWQIMEICGGQTHALLKYGIDQLLPDQVNLIHGPGCPVCVTPSETIDLALELASQPEITFCSFGDMARVPGSQRDLLQIKAAGGDVQLVYSPMDALELAKTDRDREVVFFAVGFETTAPLTALTLKQAEQLGLTNFSVLCAHVRVLPAIEAMLGDPTHRIDGLLTAGHVCAITGFEAYHELAYKYRVPMVVTGFEPLDLLAGIYRCIQMLEADTFEVENAYRRAVRPQGNQVAQAAIEEVFQQVDCNWRGLGPLPKSGFGLRAEFARFDAMRKFALKPVSASDSHVCIAGEVLQGKKVPTQCPAFVTRCHPESPLGAPMVSNEGACSAYYHYRTEALST